MKTKLTLLTILSLIILSAGNVFACLSDPDLYIKTSKCSISVDPRLTKPLEQQFLESSIGCELKASDQEIIIPFLERSLHVIEFSEEEFKRLSQELAKAREVNCRTFTLEKKGNWIGLTKPRGFYEKSIGRCLIPKC